MAKIEGIRLVVGYYYLLNLLYTFWNKADSKYRYVHYNVLRHGGSAPYEARTQFNITLCTDFALKFKKCMEEIGLNKYNDPKTVNLQNGKIQMKFKIVSTHSSEIEAAKTVDKRLRAINKYFDLDYELNFPNDGEKQFSCEKRKNPVSICARITEERIVYLFLSNNHPHFDLSKYDDEKDLETYIRSCIGKIEVRVFGKTIAMTKTISEARRLKIKINELYNKSILENWPRRSIVPEICISQPFKGRRYHGNELRDIAKSLLSLR